MFHPDFPGKSANLLGLSTDGLFGRGFSTGWVPGAGYRIDRTDYSAPLALDLNQLPTMILQQIHDGSMRGALIQAAKILRDPDIKAAMIEHTGRETYEAFRSWIRLIANSKSPELSMAGNQLLGVAEYVRRNVITNMVGLNTGTVLKHAPTALVQSIAQVGLVPMLKAYAEIFGTDEESGLSVRKMIHEKSLEIQRRNRGAMENMFGAVEDLHTNGKYLNQFLKFRSWAQWASSKPIALADAFSAEPMWLAAYRQQKAAGMTEGDAVYYADKLVRKAHGSTSVTSQPMVMHDLSKWFVPMYNFYNDVVNRAVEGYWRAGESVKAFKAEDYENMQRHMKAAAISGFASIIMPVVFHNLVEPPETHPDDSWPMRLLRDVAHPFSASLPIIRELVPFLMGSQSPDTGMFTTAAKEIAQFPKDTFQKQTGPAHTEKLIRDGGTFLGVLTGVPGRQLGAWAGAGYGLSTGEEAPQGPWGAGDLERYGTTRGHSQTMDQYMQGQYDRRR
jgi:hypothetical protein